MTQVLVVDDSVSMRDMVKATLSSAGYEVQEGEHGEAALHLAKSLPFDAVITDVNMPVMDGIHLVKALRELADYTYTPILLLTTESSAAKKAEGKRAGATGWTVKLFNPETLLETMTRIVD